MKTITKSFIVRKEKVEQIMIERNILELVDHPFVVNLHYAFQSVQYIHFIFKLVQKLSLSCLGLLSWPRVVFPS